MHAALQLVIYWGFAFLTLGIALVLLNIFFGVVGLDTATSRGEPPVHRAQNSVFSGGWFLPLIPRVRIHHSTPIIAKTPDHRALAGRLPPSRPGRLAWRLIMRDASFRSIVAALIALLSVGLLTGCATHQENASKGLSEDQYRFLYPRKYLDSLDPAEREELERRVMWDEMRRERRERK